MTASAVVTFNQPEKRNAMSVEMWERDGRDPRRVRRGRQRCACVVLTGAGDKAFVSGADISQFEKQRTNADAQREYDRAAPAPGAPS